MSDSFQRSTQKVQSFLHAAGVTTTVLEMPDSTRTSADAAEAIGCTVAQIAKSIVFRGQQTGRGIMVIASGVNRINETRISEVIGEPLSKADAKFVREKTGFVIGGVPPFAHAEPLVYLIDEALFALDEIWAAAGTPHSVFRLTAPLLQQLTKGTVLTVT